MWWSKPGETSWEAAISARVSVCFVDVLTAIADANAGGVGQRYGQEKAIPGSTMYASHGINTHKNERSKHAGK